MSSENSKPKTPEVQEKVQELVSKIEKTEEKTSGEEVQKHSIEVGFGEDGTPYFEVAGSISPVQALGLSAFLEMHIKDITSRHSNLTNAQQLRGLVALEKEMAQLRQLIESGVGAILRAIQMSTQGVAQMVEVLGERAADKPREAVEEE